jgi:hypothetical protein
MQWVGSEGFHNLWHFRLGPQRIARDVPIPTDPSLNANAIRS